MVCYFASVCAVMISFFFSDREGEIKYPDHIVIPNTYNLSAEPYTNAPPPVGCQ